MRAHVRILFISHLYPPEIAAAAARVSELSQRWVSAGHAVTVITGYPNHPTGRVPPAYAGHYWWRYQRECAHGVHLLRSPQWTAANAGRLRRSCAFASASLSATLAAPLLRGIDVVVATSPHPLSMVPALATQLLRRTPMVLDLRDLWPEQMLGLGFSPHSLPVAALRRLVALAYRRANCIVTVSPAYAPVLTRDYSVPPDKIEYLPNGVDLSTFLPSSPPLRQQFGLDPSHFVVGFVGTLGMSQRFGPMLEAAERLQAHAPDVRFLIVGEGASRARIESEIRRRNLGNVRLFGLQPRALMPGLLASLNAGLVLLDENPYFRVALPSKLFELMAMQLPIVLMAEGVAADLLARSRSGVAAADAVELEHAILGLRRMPERARALGRQGRAFVAAEFDRDQLAARYLDLLRQVAAATAKRARARASG